LREQLRQNEELRSMQESAYREREGSPAVRFKEPLYDNYVPLGVTVRQRSDQTKKPAQPTAGLVHAKPQPDITPFHFLTIDLYESKHQSETYNLTMMMYHHRLQLLHMQYLSL
jgi:hypothetical protein